ncbi:MAG: glycerophosphodiester phosphodiesterase [Actinomycetota bacterium]
MLSLPFVIGHRGAALVAPENTLASFRAAAEAGARMVEFDVRLSRDGRPVVFHDGRLERTTSGRGRVRDHDLAALQELDAGSWFAPGFAGQAIPTLAQTLALCLELGLAVNIEIKPDRGREAETARAALAEAAALWPHDRPPPLVSSFAAACLDVAGAVAPHWPRGLLVGRVPRDWRARTARLGCVALHADQRYLDAATVGRVAAAGLLVLAYTVNERTRADQLRRAGVAAVFSDIPATFMES